MRGLKEVTSLAVFLHRSKELKGIKVFKYEKKSGFSGEYIIVNHIPSAGSEAVNNMILNVNVHVPDIETGEPDTSRFDDVCSKIEKALPPDTFIDGEYFSINGVPALLKDEDDTHFVNIKVNVIYNALKIK